MPSLAISKRNTKQNKKNTKSRHTQTEQKSHYLYEKMYRKFKR